MNEWIWWIVFSKFVGGNPKKDEESKGNKNVFENDGMSSEILFPKWGLVQINHYVLTQFTASLNMKLPE